MRAIGYQEPGTIDRTEALVDIELPDPNASGQDLLVEVKAVSVNPVDTKVRAGSGPIKSDWRVLGWDAAGVVRAVGPEVRGFEPGDEVFYAGSIGRDGTNAELHLVDERIVGKKPASLFRGQQRRKFAGALLQRRGHRRPQPCRLLASDKAPLARRRSTSAKAHRQCRRGTLRQPGGRQRLTNCVSLPHRFPAATECPASKHD